MSELAENCSAAFIVVTGADSSGIAKLKNRPAKTEKEKWLKALIERRGVNYASMALANKNARTAYTLLKNNTDYSPVLIAS